MESVFKCPMCGAPLEYTNSQNLTITCPFCRNTVIIPQELRSQVTGDTKLESDAIYKSLCAMLKADQRMEAIRLYRQLYNVSLKEAVNAIELIETGKLTSLENLAHEFTPHGLNKSDNVLFLEIKTLLLSKKKIDAIKLVRQHYQVDLREAKMIVEKIESGQISAIPERIKQHRNINLLIEQLGSDKTIKDYVENFSSNSSAHVNDGQSEGNQRKKIFVAFGISFLIILITTLLIYFSWRRDVQSLSNVPTAIPSPSMIPSFTPTLEYASQMMSFGSDGIGVGKFINANSITVDMNGNIYVSDNEGKRIEKFSSSGEFIAQWMVDEHQNIRQVVAGYNDVLFANINGIVYYYHQETGEIVQRIEYQDEEGDKDDFISLFASPGGGFVASWVNQSLEKDSIIQFDRSGQMVHRIENALSEQTGMYDPYIHVAMDGLGNIYALGGISKAVCKFSSQGKFLNRFGSQGNKPGQFQHPDAIAVDGQGYIYIEDSMVIHIFDSNGSYIDDFNVGEIIDGMTFDTEDNLFILTSNRVRKYAINQRP